MRVAFRHVEAHGIAIAAVHALGPERCIEVAAGAGIDRTVGAMRRIDAGRDVLLRVQEQG